MVVVGFLDSIKYSKNPYHFFEYISKHICIPNRSLFLNGLDSLSEISRGESLIDKVPKSRVAALHRFHPNGLALEIVVGVAKESRR